jgi:hypothetical protein
MEARSLDRGSDPNSLEIGADPTFEARALRVATWCWRLIVVTLLAGLAGVLGRGWFSQSEVNASDGSVYVQYERLLHSRTPARMLVRVRPVSPDGQVRVWVSRELLEHTRLDPGAQTPVKMEGGEEGGTVFTFATTKAADLRVSFEQQAIGPASVQGQIRVAGAPPMTIRQIVMP